MEGTMFEAGTKPSFLFEHPDFYHLALLRLNQVGPVAYRKNVERFGSEKAVFFVKPETLKQGGFSTEAIQQISQINHFVNNKQEITSEVDSIILKKVKQDIQWLQHPQHELVTLESDDYPERLRQIHDCPPLLFVIGNKKILSQPQIAIVGSRRPTRSGCINAETFAKNLVTQGLVVTSGLASGIDSFAHQGALSASGHSTIAVLAHGLDALYPKRNQALAAQIINSGGALVSEFPVGVQPLPEFFPRRNRIISGLSLGVLVVEAAKKSGSLITAYSALEQNREVFAIPGSIHNEVAKGCHQLIRNGAKLVENCEDIFEELSAFIPSSKAQHNNADEKGIEEPALSTLEKGVLKFLSYEECSANQIAAELNLQIDEVSAALMLLEIKNLVIQGSAGYCLQHQNNQNK